MAPLFRIAAAFLPFTLLLLSPFRALQAQETLTLEQIYAGGRLSPRGAGSFEFLNDGRHYTRLGGNAIVRYDLLTGEAVDTVYRGGDDFRIEGYAFSADERRILLETGHESLYRHTYLADYAVWDLAEKRLYPVSAGGKQQSATFSPDGLRVAFVRDNDLYVSDYRAGTEIAITTDGERNRIINGAPDWVYEEEFTLVRAFEWSPDGRRIAFFRFDESAVPEFTMDMYRNAMYPERVTFKYPKVGEANAIVEVRVHDLQTGNTLRIDPGPERDQYIPRIAWTQDPAQLCMFRMNRHQNDLELLLCNVNDGSQRSLLRETNARYIDIHDNLIFLQDGRHFLWSSEKDGWNHLYLHDMNGKEVQRLTKGKWEVTEFYGMDERNEMAYFQAARRSPLRREVYEVSLKGGEPRPVRDLDGTNGARFSSTFDYLVASQSDINSPPRHEVCRRSGETVRTIEDNGHVVQAQRRHAVQPVEFFSFNTSEGVDLNGWMIKPAGFDPAKKYPVFMFLYGGPGSQQVLDAWRGSNYWWFQLLAREGVLVACVDNRGTGGRGEEFKKMTYLQLGHYETIDQIEAARHLGGLPYVDASRIGIYGWSYGGYMSSLCLLKGNDVFRMAIAVAPVTNWKWYDSIYTERYMRTEKENAEGYRNNSPTQFADRLKGEYLIIHGLADDNVHFQNSAEMVEALIAANKPFDSEIYTNRNHGIGGGNARLHVHTRMTEFIRRTLGR